MAPSTFSQLMILIAFFLPGLVYQTVRARLAGEAPQNKEFTAKLLRALAASVVLISLYLIVLGPAAVEAVDGDAGHVRPWVLAHTRRTGVLTLLLLFAVPALAALVAARRWLLGSALINWSGS